MPLTEEEQRPQKQFRKWGENEDKFKFGYIKSEAHVAHPDPESTKKGEVRSGVVEKILAEKRELESLVYSKARETPRDNTQRDKKKKTKVK